MTRLKLGMVGGGQGAFIGAVHRIAARIDGRFDLVAGALSSDPARAAASAAELGIERSYDSYEAMAVAEAARDDGIDAVAIVTPNHMHAGPAIAFLKAGIHVICDKPLAATAEDAAAIQAAVAASNAQFFTGGFSFWENTSTANTGAAGAHTHTLSGSTATEGSSGTDANLQPYITVYMWKRTA